MAFIEYTRKAKEPANSKRSTKDTATLKVKRSTISIGFSGHFMETHKLDFSKGARIWFDSESKTIKIGMSQGADLVSNTSESGYQSISIGRILKSFGFKVSNSAFNLPIKVNDKSVSIVLEQAIRNGANGAKNTPKKKSA